MSIQFGLCIEKKTDNHYMKVWLLGMVALRHPIHPILNSPFLLGRASFEHIHPEKSHGVQERYFKNIWLKKINNNNNKWVETLLHANPHWKWLFTGNTWATALKPTSNRALLHPPALRRSETAVWTPCTSSAWFSRWRRPGRQALQFFQCSAGEWGCLRGQDRSRAAPGPRPGKSRPCPVNANAPG